MSEKRGRPKIQIDKDNFEKLCAMQCTLKEISGFFNCSTDTIERFCKREYKQNFKDVFDLKSTDGKISLRRNMFKQAETNVTMAIWLSKQYLEMSDKQIINATPEKEKEDEGL